MSPAGRVYGCGLTSLVFPLGEGPGVLSTWTPLSPVGLVGGFGRAGSVTSCRGPSASVGRGTPFRDFGDFGVSFVATVAGRYTRQCLFVVFSLLRLLSLSSILFYGLLYY